MPAARPVDPDSPPRKGPRVEQRAILARTRCATAARLPRAGEQKSLETGAYLFEADFQLLLLVSAFGQKRTFNARVKRRRSRPPRMNC